MNQSTPSQSRQSIHSNSLRWFGKVGVLTVALASCAVSTTQATGLVLDENDLTIAPTGILNLKRGNVIVRGVGAAPSDYVRIRNYVVSGYAAGALNGFGINSSDAATDPNFVTAVGVLDNSQFFLGTPGQPFQGKTDLVGDETLGKFTYYGDADLSGFVDDNDQSLLDLGRGSGINEWWAGNFDYFGTVDDNDQSLLDFGRGSQGAPLVAQGAQFGAVPEPGTLGLLAFGIIGLLRRGQNRKA